jgi:FMN phosphatase YigB (HAD superfamily)
MILKRLIFIAYFGLTSAQALATQWHIFFDLPKTLIEPNEMSFFKDVIGVSSGLTFTMLGGNPWKLEETMFKTMDTMGAQHVEPELLARSHKERVLPQIYCDVLNGTLRGEAAFDKVKHQIKKLDKESFYHNKRERNLIIKIAQAIFDPHALAEHTAIISEGLELVKACASRHGSQNLYILANWDLPSMLLLLKADHMHSLMRYFHRDRLFISGAMKHLLPNAACFKRPIKQLNLNPQQCVFISGIPHHVQAARKFGMKAFLVKKNNYHETHQELINLGIL